MDTTIISIIVACLITGVVVGLIAVLLSKEM